MFKSAKWIWILNFITHVVYSAVAVRIDPFLRKNPLWGDAEHFHDIAVSLAHGGAFELQLHRSPLFPLTMAGIYNVFGVHPELIRILNGLLIFIAPMFLFPLVKDKFGEKTAKWFLFVYAVHPLIIHISGWLYSEPLMIFLACATAGLYYQCHKSGYRLSSVIAMGIVLGLSSLTRSSALPFTLLMCVWFLISAPKGRKIISFALALGVAAVVIAPWTVRNYHHYHHFVPVALGGKHLWASNNDLTDGRVLEDDADLPTGILNGKVITIAEASRGMTVYEKDQLFGKIGAEWIKTNPIQFILLIPKKLYFTFAPISYSPKTASSVKVPIIAHVVADFIYGLFLIFAAIGMWRTWKESWKELLPIWLFGALLIASVIVFNGSSRYLLPFVPGLCLYFALGLLYRKKEVKA